MPLKKKDFSMKSKIVAFPGLPKQRTKHDHLDPVDRTLEWKKGVLLILIGVLAYIVAGHFLAAIGKYPVRSALVLAVGLSGYMLAARATPEDLSQVKFPSIGLFRW